jgi:hypothetical protein
VYNLRNNIYLNIIIIFNHLQLIFELIIFLINISFDIAPGFFEFENYLVSIEITSLFSKTSLFTLLSKLDIIYY